MDLAQYDTKKASEDGAEFALKDPATKRPIKGDDGENVIFHVIGKHSETYIKAQTRITNRRLKEVRGRGPQSSAEELEDEAIELLSVAVVSWTNNFKVDALQLECTPVNVRRLLSDPRFRWIREQVDEFVGDIANFLPA